MNDISSTMIINDDILLRIICTEFSDSHKIKIKYKNIRSEYTLLFQIIWKTIINMSNEQLFRIF